MRPSQYAAAYAAMTPAELMRVIDYLRQQHEYAYDEAISRLHQCIQASERGDQHAKDVAAGQAAFAENRAHAVAAR